jgi:hypothetical protein
MQLPIGGESAVTDEEVQGMSYADLWRAELGGCVPQYRPPLPPEPPPRPGRRRKPRRLPVPPAAPDPTRPE